MSVLPVSDEGGVRLPVKSLPNSMDTAQPLRTPAVAPDARWEVTISPAARATGIVRRMGDHTRVALAEAANGREATGELLAATIDAAALGPGLELVWSTAVTLIDLRADGHVTVACLHSPPVLVMCAKSITWLSPLLPGPGGKSGECVLQPGDRLVAMTPSCVAHLDPRLLRSLSTQAPLVRSADDLADLLITRVYAEDRQGWRRQCAYGFVIVTRTI